MIRDDLAYRLFYIFETAVRMQFATHDEAARAFAAAAFLSGGKHYVTLFEKLQKTAAYPNINRNGAKTRKPYVA